MEGSTSNHIPKEDEIQPVHPNEGTMAEDDDERCQLLLNISIDKIDASSGDSIHTETDSFSSNSSLYQLSTMEKFNYVATRILYSKYFQFYYFFIIILSGISIVMSYFLECTNHYLLILEALIIFALIIEVTIRLLAKRKYFFYSFWNILDVIIIAVCVWLFFITLTECPVSDSIIDNSILVVRYVIQFTRLGILLKKNKTSGANKKRKSVNFNQLRKKSTYGSFNPSSSNFPGKEKDKSFSQGEGIEEEEEEGEKVEGSSYQNIHRIINPNIYNPYGVRYGSIDDTHEGNIYAGIPNESFVAPVNPSLLSQSLAREYTAYLQESQGSIDINIDSNANLAKMFYREEGNGEGDVMGRKPSMGVSVSVGAGSLHSANNDIYQKLIHSNIENNNRNSYGALPNTTTHGSNGPNGPNGPNGVPEPRRQTTLSSTTLPERGPSNDSLSTNPIDTPSSSFFSPSSFSYLSKKSLSSHLPYPSTSQTQPPPQPQPQKSSSSTSIPTETDTSFTLSLPPKVGRKTAHRMAAPTNHSSTFSEVPSRVNLLTPILYGSPGTFSTKN